MEQIVSKYLTDIKVPISKKYVEKLIASHPNYPSMLSVADTLQRLGIRYKAARIEEKYLNKVKYPYLIWPDEGGIEPKIVRDRQDLPGNGMQDSDNTETGKPIIILKAEPTDRIADEKNDRQRSQDHFFKLLSGVLVAAVTGLIFLNLLPILDWGYAWLFVVALGGTGVGYLLIAKDVGISYKPIEDFCRAGEKNSCDAVLNSEAARLFGDKITLSDAAASYFLFQLMVLGLFVPLSGEISSYYGILASLSFVALPVVIYSLFYQVATVRTWCRLCLIVDGILLVQAGLFGYMYAIEVVSFWNISLLAVFMAAFLLIATGSGLLLIKNMLKEKKESRKAEVLANRIKYNPKVFLNLLQREKNVDTTPFEQEMVIGNTEAPVRILMAASLSCSPCKTGFEKAVQLVVSYPQHINLSIRLRTSGRSNGDITPSIALLDYWKQQIHGMENASKKTKKLFRDWYEYMDQEKFSNQYPLDENTGNNGDIEQLEDLHAQWMKREKISATPTFFINGYQLPRAYQIDDLMEMVPGLVDHIEQLEMRQNTFVEDKELAITQKHMGGSNKG